MLLERSQVGLMLVMVLAAAITLLACSQSQSAAERVAVAISERRQEQEQLRRVRAEQGRQATVNRVVGDILYIKDIRPNPDICFAYYWSRGATLATVPCDSIPKELLTTAEIGR